MSKFVQLSNAQADCFYVSQKHVLLFAYVQFSTPFPLVTSPDAVVSTEPCRPVIEALGHESLENCTRGQGKYRVHNEQRRNGCPTEGFGE